MLIFQTLRSTAISLIGLTCLRLHAGPPASPEQGTHRRATDGPLSATYDIVKDVPYLEPGRTEKLDIYLPFQAANKLTTPAVIWIHGNQGDKDDSDGRNVCETLASAGYICASINYGPWTNYQTDRSRFVRKNLADAKNAVRFLKVHSAEYHVDPARIAVFGGSGGATLALLLGFTSDLPEFEPSAPYPGVSSKVKAIGNLYGTSDPLTHPRLKKEIATMSAADLEKLRLISSVTYVTPHSPPVLILQGRADPLNDYHQSIELDQVLTTMDVPHEFVLIDNVGHDFDFTTWNGHSLPYDLRPIVLAFLNKYLGPAS